MNFSLKSTALGLALLGALGADAASQGWPADYGGVMLQGFYWDSYTDTRWTNLTSQADELSEYFDLIWVPNSGKCGSNKNMGYMPQYWFTNHNSSFGTEAQLRTMIRTFKEKGTGIIADVVINHRNGVTNWYDFPTETWNGRTWHIGLEGICSNDEMASAAGQPKPTGNRDTGENFDGCRDLDHTNANVQDNCKNYCKFLLEDLGYAGFRYDMVKGYSGQYTKMYNDYSGTQFSVGEYWDGSYDAVKAWIDASGSAAFDFPCKYQINKAWAQNNMTELVWKANGTTDQPAGMIHFGYPRYAVTFVDNHDTYRSEGNNFTGNVVAANAFILCSPGTPCVFLYHWKDHKAEIGRLIKIRKAVGLTNQSAVRVLRSTRDCYMAEVTGTKGKLVVKIGPAMVSPDGYTDSQIRASGTDYCVWSAVEIGGGDDPQPQPTVPDNLYLMGNVKGAHWSTSAPVAMTDAGDGVMQAEVELETGAGETHCFFNLAEKKGATWDDVNSGHRYGSTNEGDLITVEQPAAMVKYTAGVNASGCKSYKVAPGKYWVRADFANNTITVSHNPYTAIGKVEATEDDAPAVYYNLQGARVDNPTAGLYIVVRGKHVGKEYIR